MIHFAYPNALAREDKFLGCGRQLAAPLDNQLETKYQRVRLNIPNIAQVHTAVQRLAPESGDTQQVIYETRDPGLGETPGESLDFAYVLAMISRSRPLKITPLQRDIWCTGSIDIVDNRPALQAVKQPGFEVKLRAFLAEANPDSLFLAPAANILPDHELLFQQTQSNVLSFEQFREQPVDLSTGKTILKVGEFDLEELTARLFIRPAATQNPYRSLFPFREADAEFFFGRETFTTQLVERVAKQPLVAVIGASGSGKSSVVFAGLLPALRQQGPWQIIALRPGGNPFQALALALTPLLAAGQKEIARIETAKELTGKLTAGKLTLTDILLDLRQQQPDARLLLVVDQFEELYTLCPNETERQRFIDELLGIRDVPGTLGSAGHVVKVVFTLRADFLGKASSYRPLADALQPAALILGPMNREELRDAIEQPAARSGVRIEAGLTDRILEFVAEKPGSLPLLEFALTELWQRQTDGSLTEAAYNAIGGVAQALAAHAERIYNALSPAEQAQTQRIFTQLIRPGEGTEDTRRVATRAEIGAEHWALVTKLADARLVVTNRSANFSLPEDPQTEVDTPEETVELTHEALIQHWQRLREWINADREFRTWQERLRKAKRDWEQLKFAKSELLRGAALATAKDWLSNRHNDLSQAEQQFIETSVQVHRSSQRRRRFGMAIAFAFAVVVAVVFGILWKNAETQRQIADQKTREATLNEKKALQQTQIAENQTKQAEKARQESEINEIEALNQTSRALFLNNEDIDALLTGVKAGTKLKKTNVPPILKYQTTLNLRQIIYGVHKIKRIVGNVGSSINTIAFSPDGKLLATGTEGSYNDPATIKLWSVADGKEIESLNHYSDVYSLAFSPDLKFLASGHRGDVLLWNIADRQEVKLFDSVDTNSDSSESDSCRSSWAFVDDVTFSPDGTMFAAKLSCGKIQIWKIPDNTEIKTLLLEVPECRGDIAFSSDSKLLAVAACGITIWNFTDDIKVHISTPEQYGHSLNSFHSIEFSPDGKMLASNDYDSEIIILDFSKLRALLDDDHNNRYISDYAIEKEIGVKNIFHDSVTGFAFHPSGKLLASFTNVGFGIFKGEIKLWSTTDGVEIRTLSGYMNPVQCIGFSPDGTLLASGHQDGSIQLWSVPGDVEAKTLSGEPKDSYSDQVKAVAFSPNGTLIASGSGDDTINLWNVADGSKIKTLQGHTSDILSLDFSPNGDILASGSAEIKLWNVTNGLELKTLAGDSWGIGSIAFDSTGELLASGSGDGSVRLWNIADGNELTSFAHGRLDCIEGYVDCSDGAYYHSVEVTFSQDGSLLASGSYSIRLWNLVNNNELKTLKGHSELITSIAFNSNGKLLASASLDGTVKLWNVSDGREIRTLTINCVNDDSSFCDNANHVLFSPDDALLIVGISDGSIKLYWVDDGKELGTLYGYAGKLYSIAFSSAGKWLASGNDKQIIKLWNLDLNDLLSHGCDKILSYLKTTPELSEIEDGVCTNK